jgi:hypothetical protein
VELKRVVDALRPEFSDQIAFVLVNLATPEGRIWAMSQFASETTLVFFGASGRRVHMLQGQQDLEYLREIFRQFAATGRYG